jgi:diguanylate cyclase (GGDEF)-like protein
MRSEKSAGKGFELQLVALLYNQTLTLVGGGIAMPVVALICWIRTHQTWFLIWDVLLISLLAVRMALDLAFRTYQSSASVDAWRNRFVIGAWLMGVLCGAAALTIVVRDDPFVQLFGISIETVVIMGAAARNSSCPLAARGQAVLGMIPIAAACLAVDDPYYRALGGFLFAGFFAVENLIRHMHNQHIRLMTMNEENAILLHEVRAANADLAAANRRLEVAATTDALTAIANRRSFDVALAEEVRLAHVQGRELALLLLDIDAFKGFNDLYGHQAGDACLQRVAATLASAFRRPTDVVARYGGEEFAAILPHTDVWTALELAEGLRAAVEALGVRSAASSAGVVSVSIGVAVFVPQSHARTEDLVRAADEALYAAKAAGRNCVRLMRRGSNACAPGRLDPLTPEVPVLQ